MVAELVAARPASPPRIEVINGVVQIHHLSCPDQDLAALLSTADDREIVVRQALAAGARVLAVTQARLDTAMVEHAFTDLQANLAHLITEAGNNMTASADQLLHDPQRGVTTFLDRWRDQVAELLAATFDPSRSDSATATLDAVMRAAGDRQVSATRTLLNPDTEDGPLAQVLGRVREQFAAVLDAVGRLAEQVSADRASTAATRTALERSAVKGLAYEDHVATIVTELAAVHGDVAEAVGRTRGGAGSRVGDVIVDVASTDPDQDTAARYVLEAKDRKLSLRATLNELTSALRNREAGAAVAVFSRQEHAPVSVPFRDFGQCAIVVLDKDDNNTAALSLACGWARWVAQRDARTPDAPQLDLLEFTALLGQGRRALEQLSAFRRSQTLAKKHIDESSGHIDTFSSSVADVLTRLRALTP